MLAKKWYKLAYMLIVSCNCWYPVHADTMDHYMNIVNNIPKMEIKADGQSQVWAKSARNVLLLTCESVAESMVIANTNAQQQGAPLFCLPASVTLDGNMLINLIQQTYNDLSGQESAKAKMTVSEVALIGLSHTHPCSKQAHLGRVIN